VEDGDPVKEPVLPGHVDRHSEEDHPPVPHGLAWRCQPSPSSPNALAILASIAMSMPPRACRPANRHGGCGHQGHCAPPGPRTPEVAPASTSSSYVDPGSGRRSIQRRRARSIGSNQSRHDHDSPAVHDRGAVLRSVRGATRFIRTRRAGRALCGRGRVHRVVAAERRRTTHSVSPRYGLAVRERRLTRASRRSRCTPLTQDGFDPADGNPPTRAGAAQNPATPSLRTGEPSHSGGGGRR
jgi:hypothetical protein